MISHIKKRNVTLRAFSIENHTISKPHSDLFEKLSSLVSSGSSSIETRKMGLRPRNGRTQEDVLSFFSDEKSNYLFCTMMRLDSTGDSPQIDRVFFEKNKFALSQLKLLTIDGHSLYKSHYHFCLNQTHLVTDLENKIPISRLEAYLYWLFNSPYSLNPIPDLDHIQNLRNVKKITVSTPRSDPNQNLIEEPKNLASEIRILANRVVKGGLVDTANLNELLLDHIISAHLTVELDDPKYAEKAEIEKVYSAILKPVSDLDHYAIRTRSGKTLAKGEKLLLTKNVEISIPESKLGDDPIEEKTLENAMVQFLNEIK